MDGPHLFIFFSSGDIHVKGLFALLHSDPQGITEVDTDPKGGFVSFKVTPLPLMSSPWDIFLKDYKIILQLKTRKMKTK